MSDSDQLAAIGQKLTAALTSAYASAIPMLHWYSCPAA
jgi:hypothetical protein